MAVSDWKVSASLNTTLGGITIAPGMARSDVDNAIRMLMAEAKAEFDDILENADLTLYVNASTGSDTTGDGTSGTPYATPQKAVDAVATLTRRTSVVIDIAAGTYSTSSRSAASMDRPAVIYIDGMKIGKRTAQSGSTLSGGLVLKLAAGAKITPNTTYPRGIYVTGHVGSVGIVGGEIEAAAGGTEGLLIAHRGSYVHCRSLTLDGNSIASFGALSEAGGVAEMIDCTATGSTTDSYTYPGGRIQWSSPGDSSTVGSFTNGGVTSVGDYVVISGNILHFGEKFESVVSEAAKAVELQGDFIGYGGQFIGPWVNFSDSTVRVEFHNMAIRGDAWKFDAQFHLFDTVARGNSWESYIARLDYDAETTAFTKGETVTGGSSGATGIIWRVVDEGSGTGYLLLRTITGAFTNDETLTGSSGGGATADGASDVNSSHTEPVVLYGESQCSGRYDTATSAWGTQTIRNSAGIVTGPVYAQNVQSFSSSAGTIALHWSGAQHTVTRVENTSGGTLTNMVLAGTLATNSMGGGNTPPDGSLWTFYTTSTNSMVFIPSTTIVTLPGSSLTVGTAAATCRSFTLRWSRQLAKFELMPFTVNIQTAPTNTYASDLTVTATSGTLPTPNGSVTIADAATPTVAELLELCMELNDKVKKLASDDSNHRSKTQAAKIHA